MENLAEFTLGTGMVLTSLLLTEQHRQRPSILLPAGAWPLFRPMYMNTKPIVPMVMTTHSGVRIWGGSRLILCRGSGGERGSRPGGGEPFPHRSETLPPQLRIQG